MNEDEEKLADLVHLFKCENKEFTTITNMRYIDFCVKNAKTETKMIHCLTPELTAISMNISMLSGAILEIILRRETWFDSLQIAYERKCFKLPKDVKLTDIKLDEPEAILGLLSANLMQNLELTKKFIFRRSSKIKEWCDTTAMASAKFLEKCVNPIVVRKMEKMVETAIAENKSASYIRSLEREIQDIKKAEQEIKHSLLDLAEIFISNIRILVVYIYTFFISEIIRTYEFKEKFLITICADDYSIFIGLLATEFKDKPGVIKVHIFGDVSQKVEDEKIAKDVKEKKKLEEEKAKRIAEELLREEEEEKRLKEEKQNEEKRIQKERMKEQARLEEEARLAEQARLEEELRKAEQLRLEQIRLSEEIKLAEQARVREEIKQKRRERSEKKKLKKKQEHEERKRIEEEENARKKQLNPSAVEFQPKILEAPEEPKGIYLSDAELGQMEMEFCQFRIYPFFYIQYPNAFLFQMMEREPRIFRHQDIQAYQMAKQMFLFWNHMSYYADPISRDVCYGNLRNLECKIYEILNS